MQGTGFVAGIATSLKSAANAGSAQARILQYEALALDIARYRGTGDSTNDSKQIESFAARLNIVSGITEQVTPKTSGRGPPKPTPSAL
jgi:hypothetical protein